MNAWDVLRELVRHSTMGGADKDRLYAAIDALQKGSQPPPPRDAQPPYWSA